MDCVYLKDECKSMKRKTLIMQNMFLATLVRCLGERHCLFTERVLR